MGNTEFEQLKSRYLAACEAVMDYSTDYLMNKAKKGFEAEYRECFDEMIVLEKLIYAEIMKERG